MICLAIPTLRFGIMNFASYVQHSTSGVGVSPFHCHFRDSDSPPFAVHALNPGIAIACVPKTKRSFVGSDSCALAASKRCSSSEPPLLLVESRRTGSSAAMAAPVP